MFKWLIDHRNDIAQLLVLMTCTGLVGVAGGQALSAWMRIQERKRRERERLARQREAEDWLFNLKDGDVLRSDGGTRHTVYGGTIRMGAYVHTLTPSCRRFFELEERPGPW